MPTENKPAEPLRREDRYNVIKYTDLDRIPRAEKLGVNGFLRKIHESVLKHGSPARSFLVIESDWPEYEPAWRMIERRMTGQPAVTAAEELDAVLHWRDIHAQAIRERDALQLLLNAADQRIDELTARPQGDQATVILPARKPAWASAPNNEMRARLECKNKGYNEALDDVARINSK